VKLASATNVLNRVSINPSLTGGVSSAEAGLDAATVLLSNLLETKLDVVIVRDYYSPTLDQAGTAVQLYLSRMFLNEEETVEVSYGEYSGDVDDDTYTVLDPKYYTVDYEQGKLKITSLPAYGTLSILVSYTSGFSGESDSTIPDWLKEAAISSAVYVMHTQVAAHGKQDILDISPEYRRMVYAMVQQHLRPRLSCLFADQSFTES